ncbi:hypothetical protein BJF78_22875 [Pseudonocardia sp. CNS-139]|nr:hypothetical protein BJF78_22875 [Pseudonocardia sp. CNS-139]
MHGDAGRAHGPAVGLQTGGEQRGDRPVQRGVGAPDLLGGLHRRGRERVPGPWHHEHPAAPREQPFQARRDRLERAALPARAGGARGGQRVTPQGVQVHEQGDVGAAAARAGELAERAGLAGDEAGQVVDLGCEVPDRRVRRVRHPA